MRHALGIAHGGASQIVGDLHGPGSGVKGFSVEDPENNHLTIVQEAKGDRRESW
jgi:hypothetical protein